MLPQDPSANRRDPYEEAPVRCAPIRCEVMSKSTGRPAFRRKLRPYEGLWLVVAIAALGPSACGTSDSRHGGDSGTASTASGSGGALDDGAMSDDRESGVASDGSSSAKSPSVIVDHALA
jgi:hypothetical protein